MSLRERLRRESEFHDSWAKSTRPDDVLVFQCFEAPTAVENQFILRQLGSLKGKRILDIGAGLGESSIYFALCGARVTMVDISPGMVASALALSRRYGVEIEGVVSSGEELQVPVDAFDYAYISNTIHHAQDRARLFEQIRKSLRPGGKFFSIDPLSYNPVIKTYRRMASAVRSRDEYPLGLADLKLAKRYFANVGHREFWLLTLSLFLKYYLIDRVHPNEDRYWKRILKETRQTLRWWMPLWAMDSFLTRLPFLRLCCWNIVMWGEKL